MKKNNKPRRMWESGESGWNSCYLTKVRLCDDDIRVAVIPLDDVDAIFETAFTAYKNLNAPSRECVRAALEAIGVLPKQRKERK
jgi:hypothetical protein